MGIMGKNCVLFPVAYGEKHNVNLIENHIIPYDSIRNENRQGRICQLVYHKNVSFSVINLIVRKMTLAPEKR